MWNYLIKKLAYPYKHFIIIKDYQKPVDNLKKKDFHSKIKNDEPCEKEVRRTEEVFFKKPISQLETN